MPNMAGHARRRVGWRSVSEIPRLKSLARQAAAESGETLTDAIAHALEKRLERLIERPTTTDAAKENVEISLRCRPLPDRGRRGADEIPGYDERALPR